MSNFPNAHKVYDLATTFRERVIEQGRSFLWPDQEIWTAENVRGVHELLISEWEEGLNVYDVPAKQLANHSQEYLMIGTDVMSAVLLFTQISRRTQEPKILTFLNAGDLSSPDDTTYQLLMEQSNAPFPGSERGYPDSWQRQYMTLLYGLLLILENDLRSDSTSEIVSLVEKKMLDSGRYWDLHMWGLLHTLYPHEIPSVAGKDSRRRILSHYGALLEGKSFANEFEAVNHIQQLLSNESGGDYFDFYDLHVLKDWSPNDPKVRRHFHSGPSVEQVSTKSRSRVLREKALVYEITRLFHDRVIEQYQSLLWPDEDLWSDQNIDQFLIDFRDMPVEKGKSWLQIYESHLLESNASSAKILADSYAYLMQFPSLDTLSHASKSATLHRMLGWTRASTPDQETLDQVIGAFGLGIGSPGQYFSINVQYQLAFVPGMVRNLRNRPDDYIRDVAKDTAQELKNSYSFSKSVLPAANVMLHFLESENFERIASQSDKIQIVERFSEQLEGIDSGLDADVDAEIRLIREKLAGTHFDHDFDFYDDNVKPYWQGNANLGSGGLDLANPDDDPKQPPTITNLAGQTFLKEDHLRDIESLLKSKKQLIFEGPPGSGKTYVAEQFARYFTGQSLISAKTNDQIELIQFHQSYSYEDFVEGIRPRMDGGQLVYHVEAGIFLRMVARAADNPDQKYVLIIDEINRGNVSRILGELMLLLEYRDKSATLPYSKDQLQIPPNLYIIGTMNTADRSLSQIDYALRRRFYFVRFMSVEDGFAPVLDGWLRQKNLDGNTRANILQMFIKLNQQLEKDLGTDDLQVGHSYFMDDNIYIDRQQQHIWTYAVLPLIREYLYHHRERESLLDHYRWDRLTRMIELVVEEDIATESLDSDTFGESHE